MKTGDTVRFLNQTGGGTVVRIDGNLAYVEDSDGFEIPMPVKECVVITNSATSASKPEKTASPKTAGKTEAQAAPVPREEPEEEELPIEQTPFGDSMNVLLGFEPQDIRRLSETKIDAYLVNDSNYHLAVTFATRSDDSDKWELRFSGVVCPNIQQLLCELDRSQLNSLENISVQYIAFKETMPYQLKQPCSHTCKFDNLKFFKLHSFKPNNYFENNVIAIPITVDDKPASDNKPDNGIERLKTAYSTPVKADTKPTHPQRPKPAAKPQVKKARGKEILEVDLHIDELVDTTAGLSPADILNLQIDTFRSVMDSNLKHKGQRIVFIHGKGEGVLKNALLKELRHRYKGHDVQDASFQEYGFGATQVTI